MYGPQPTREERALIRRRSLVRIDTTEPQKWNDRTPASIPRSGKPIPWNRETAVGVGPSGLLLVMEKVHRGLSVGCNQRSARRGSHDPAAALTAGLTIPWVEVVRDTGDLRSGKRRGRETRETRAEPRLLFRAASTLNWLSPISIPSSALEFA